MLIDDERGSGDYTGLGIEDRGSKIEGRRSKIEDRRSKIEDRAITRKAILDPRSST